MGGNTLGYKYISLGVSLCTNLLKMSCIFRRLFQRNHFHFLSGAFPLLSLFTILYWVGRTSFQKLKKSCTVNISIHNIQHVFHSCLTNIFPQHEYLFYRCGRHCQSCSGWSEFLSTVCNGKIRIRREINLAHLYLFQDLCLLFLLCFSFR